MTEDLTPNSCRIEITDGPMNVQSYYDNAFASISDPTSFFEDGAGTISVSITGGEDEENPDEDVPVAEFGQVSVTLTRAQARAWRDRLDAAIEAETTHIIESEEE